MNFISLLQYWLLPPFSTKAMEVICLVDLPGRGWHTTWTWVSPPPGLPAVRCLDTGLRKSFQVISWERQVWDPAREQGSLLTLLSISPTLSYVSFLEPFAVCAQAKGSRASVQVLCSGLDSNQRSRLSAPLCVPGAPPFSPSPLLQVLRLPATFRCDILNISKGYSHWHWACCGVELSNKKGEINRHLNSEINDERSEISEHLFPAFSRGPSICRQHWAMWLLAVAGDSPPCRAQELGVESVTQMPHSRAFWLAWSCVSTVVQGPSPESRFP